MNSVDLFLSYGISLSLVVLAATTAIVFYRLGYERGYARGWREGLSRGQAFGRLKQSENTFPDRN